MVAVQLLLLLVSCDSLDWGCFLATNNPLAPVYPTPTVAPLFTCPITMGPAPMIMMDLRSLRFLTSSMATCHGRGALPLLEAVEAVTVTAVREDLLLLLREALAGTRALNTAARLPTDAFE